MSDSIKKWHEMQEDKKLSSTTATSEGKFIYESPDGGKTVRKRPLKSQESQHDNDDQNNLEEK